MPLRHIAPFHEMGTCRLCGIKGEIITGVTYLTGTGVDMNGFDSLLCAILYDNAVVHKKNHFKVPRVTHKPYSQELLSAMGNMGYTYMVSTEHGRIEQFFTLQLQQGVCRLCGHEGTVFANHPLTNGFDTMLCAELHHKATVKGKERIKAPADVEQSHIDGMRALGYIYQIRVTYGNAKHFFVRDNASAIVSLKEQIQELLDRHGDRPARDGHSDTCVVCMDNLAALNLSNCGHHSCCLECALKICGETLVCPECREDNAVIGYYFAKDE